MAKDRNGVKIQAGDKVRWYDPAINDFTPEEQKEQLERIYEVDEVVSEELVCISDEFSEVEALPEELEKV